MKFNSFSSFIEMGGYGFFVWLSYGATFLLLALLIWFSLSGHRRTKIQIAQKLKREAKLRSAAQKYKQTEVANESTS